MKMTSFFDSLTWTSESILFNFYLMKIQCWFRIILHTRGGVCVYYSKSKLHRIMWWAFVYLIFCAVVVAGMDGCYLVFHVALTLCGETIVFSFLLLKRKTFSFLDHKFCHLDVIWLVTFQHQNIRNNWIKRFYNNFVGRKLYVV